MDPCIGTSGWHYKHWREVFYPSDLASSRWLAFYATHFDCVEINNSFYRFPSQENIRTWLAQTPPQFRFALKASRYITHQKKLKECGEPLQRFVDQAALFGEKLGPVLFQLPPRWRVNRSRLAAFLQLLPSGFRYAMEFRDTSWHCPAVWELLSEYGVAWCQYDLQGLLAPERIIAGMAYLRLHGPEPDAYCGSYDNAALRGWATKLKAWQHAGNEVWVFFDNDQAGYAPANAQQLRKLCGKQR